MYSSIFSLVATLFVVSLVSATAIRTGVAHDSTITYNARLCNGSRPCASIAKGLQRTLGTFDMDGSQDRVLLRFQLPVDSRTIVSCTLNVPVPISAPVGHYTLSISATDNNWAEDTVSGISKSRNGTDVGSVVIFNSQQLPRSVLVTSACQRFAENNTLSMFVTSDGKQVSFNSLESGSPDIFSLDVSY
ncbi:hypothetical protein DL89DRAFT_282591 [Linderina pennispora]|uniref:Carbohydrate-binding module family 96 domain-containing protein n=1 Tax=Linderina pennispora TaxID=61395 RepID=A0A1Y1WC46_9FUNG|nr:uncharacterized protein DL89DRAFT_282591 [Linderina pennispora]ORX71103.1 hypothetical protein DL89DRAFT_282591 [Linderina pennispora]